METKTRFTLGEWKVGTVIQLIPNANLGFAITTQIGGVEQPIAVVANKANAYLIAAAPDMYEALKFFVARNSSEYVYLDKGIGTKTEVGRAFLNARKALAKVEGK